MSFLPASSSGSETESHASLSFWRGVRLALRGESFDFTALSLNRAVLLLAVPMVLEMLMESLFAVVDVFWVSRLGSDAIAIVGLTESVMSLIYAVAIGISFAATAIVARRIGEKNPALAAQAPDKSWSSAGCSPRASGSCWARSRWRSCARWARARRSSRKVPTTRA
jgi:hypothetical protein